MSDPNLIRVSIRFTDSRTPRVSWTLGDAEWPPYTIDLDMIERQTGEIRKSLRRLVDKCMKDSPKALGAELKNLAKLGHDLYKGLFYSTDAYDPEEIREWLSELPGEHRISFSVDRLIHVPWGLIYDRAPDDLSGDPADVGIEHYLNFWALKYQISTIYFRITPKGIYKPIPIDLFKMLSALNKDVFVKAEPHLPEAEKEIWKRIKDKFGPPVHTSKALHEKWGEIGDEVNMLYLYCHADGTNIALGMEDVITIDNFKLNFRRRVSERDACMVFLNGCHTAAGAPGGGFLEATGGAGFCGFVGTETAVPDIFAMRFGLAFLYCLLHKGLPIFRIMDHLRRAHWPLGLIYSTYCHPLLCLQPSEEMEQSNVEFGNFSESQLGTSNDAVM